MANINRSGMSEKQVETIVTNTLTTSDSAVTTTERTNWNAAYTEKHTHDNKALLDAATATILTEDDKAVAGGLATLGEDGVIPSSQLSSLITSGLKWQSTIDVTTETVDTASDDNAGYFYKNTVAGTSSITGTEIDWTVGDWLISNGTAWQRVAATESSATTETLGAIMLAGDLGGTASAPVVTGIQGVTVDDTDKANGAVLAYDSTSGNIVYIAISTGAAYGDIKHSFQTNDHSGWIVADGRAISTLTTSQQTVATDTLGFSSTIPDLQNVFIIGAGDTYSVGDSGGSFYLARANLPKVDIYDGVTGSITPTGTVKTNISNSVSASSNKSYASGDADYSVPVVKGSYDFNSDAGSGIDGSGSGYICIDGSDVSDSTIVGSALGHSHTINVSVTSTGSSTFTGAETSFDFPENYLNGGVTQTKYTQPYYAATPFIYMGA